MKIIERDGFAFKEFRRQRHTTSLRDAGVDAGHQEHCEDLPHDIVPYTDLDGNTYGFAFGLDSQRANKRQSHRTI